MDFYTRAAADIRKIGIFEATKPCKIASVKRSRPPQTLLNSAPAVCRLCRRGWRLPAVRERERKKKKLPLLVCSAEKSELLRQSDASGLFCLHINCWQCENLRSDPIRSDEARLMNGLWHRKRLSANTNTGGMGRKKKMFWWITKLDNDIEMWCIATSKHRGAHFQCINSSWMLPTDTLGFLCTRIIKCTDLSGH